MKNSTLKIIIFLIALVTILYSFSMFNKNFLKKKISFAKDTYVNELSQKVNMNDIDDIDYAYILNDFKNIDEIVKLQLTNSMDIKKKTIYYENAEKIYSNKINEIIMILNHKLDDEDFLILQKDIDDFTKNLDYANEEINIENESTIDSKYYTNKYNYEEKRNKCKELISTYKGFLK